VLDDFGAIDTVLASGRFHLPFRHYADGKVVAEKDMHEGRYPTPDVPYASPLIIAQWRVEEILRGPMESRGHRVELGSELVAIEQNADSVRATVSRGGATEQISCRYLVGSDGGHSFVRHALNIGFEGETWASERMLVGDVCVDTLDRDHWHSWPNEKPGSVDVHGRISTAGADRAGRAGSTVARAVSADCG
jgi:2-polyprenyl-6-methoxyphenol hydroxylase-like FAD-dependent oxidoreductase